MARDVLISSGSIESNCFTLSLIKRSRPTHRLILTHSHPCEQFKLADVCAGRQRRTSAPDVKLFDARLYYIAIAVSGISFSIEAITYVTRDEIQGCPTPAFVESSDGQSGKRKSVALRFLSLTSNQ